MEFTHKGLFIPKGVDPTNVTDKKKYQYTGNEFLNSADKSSEMKSKAVSDGFINDYAMRNHWDLVLGQTVISDASWDNTERLKLQLSGIEQVDGVVKQEDKTKKSLIIKVDDDSQCRTVKNKVKSVFGSKTPIYIGYSHLELMLSVKWLGASDKFFFDDVIDLWDN